MDEADLHPQAGRRWNAAGNSDFRRSGTSASGDSAGWVA